MNVARGSPATAVIGDRIYVAGGAMGVEARDPTGRLEVFDLSTGRWSSGPDMPTPRHHAGAVAVDGKLYVLGGRSERDYSLDVVERFDPRANRWEPAPSLPLGVGALARCATGDRLLAISGGDDSEAWVTPADVVVRSGDLPVDTPRRSSGSHATGTQPPPSAASAYVFGGARAPATGSRTGSRS